jgi:hypothetical protein
MIQHLHDLPLVFFKRVVFLLRFIIMYKKAFSKNHLSNSLIIKELDKYYLRQLNVETLEAE